MDEETIRAKLDEIIMALENGDLILASRLLNELKAEL